MQETINSVVHSNLCLGCGTCGAVCPQSAINMIETPAGLLLAQIDNSKCSECGLCAKCCPGTHLEKNLLRPEVDPFKGNVIAAYLGQATDKKLLSEGQSGGIVTALLYHLLDSRQIHRALVTYMPDDGSLRPKSALTADKELIRRAQGSKYCPVPLNAAIKEISAHTDEKVAIVGLPCHIHGIRNIQSQLENFRLAEPFCIGLVCDRTLAFGAIDHLVKKASVSRSDVAYFHFRSKMFGGWPGDVCIRTRNQTIHKVANKERMMIKDIYTPLRCRLCFDKLNVLSDLTVGDAWGIRQDKEGFSVIITRTARGRDFLLSAQDAGVIHLEPIDPGRIFEGQQIEKKRTDWSAFAPAWQQMGGNVPDFGISVRWFADTRNISLRPYRRQLMWPKHLATKTCPSAVLKAAKWHSRFQRLRRKLALRHTVGSVLRRFKRLRKAATASLSDS